MFHSFLKTKSSTRGFGPILLNLACIQHFITQSLVFLVGLDRGSTGEIDMEHLANFLRSASLIIEDEMGKQCNMKKCSTVHTL